MKQQALYKITGMQKDVADSGMDKQHAYDLHNMRLRHSETNTLTALVNEVGTLKARTLLGGIPEIKGTVIGVNVLNDKGIIFTHEEDDVEYMNVPTLYDTPTSAYTGQTLRNASHTLTTAFFCSYNIDGGADTGLSSTVYYDADVSDYPTNVPYKEVTVRIKKVFNSSMFSIEGLTISAKSSNVVLLDSANFSHTSLSITGNDLLGITPRSPYIFKIRFECPETADFEQANVFNEQVDIVAAYLADNSVESVMLAPIDINCTFNVPQLENLSDPGTEPVTPEPDPVTPTYEVICDYDDECSDKQCDHIYIVTIGKRSTPVGCDDTAVEVFEYFRGDLGFSVEHPIESTVYFENEEIQKVYWVDGIHQLRYANIADKNYVTLNNIETNAEDVVYIPWHDNLMFDSVPMLHLQEEVTVTRNSTGGMFPSGTVQFAFTYLNRYGAESNIAWISPIYYSSPDDRGGKPGENCSNSFTIKITKYEPNGRFDYIRLYHIVHTTLDAEPEIRRVADIAVPVSSELPDPTTYEPIVFTDTNTTGEIVDAGEFMYLGGISLIPNTIEQKSNTLFLGGLTQEFKYLRDILDSKMTWGGDDSHNNSSFGYTNIDSAAAKVPADVRSGYYSHQNQLLYSSHDITSFRRGEQYRFGIQAQDETGRWSDVWWVGDYTNTAKYPKFSDGKLLTVQASCTLNETVVTTLRNNGFRKVRPVVVYPEPWERNIYTEGLLNPTVYNVKDRASNAPFAQSSWFLRPFSPIDMGSLSSTDDLGNYDYVVGSDHFSIIFPETESYVNLCRLADVVTDDVVTEDNHLWRDSMSYLAVDSPFFTTVNTSTVASIDLSQFGSWAEFRHNHPLGDSQQRNGEIQSMYNTRTAETGVGTKYSLRLPYIGDTNELKRGFISDWADFFYVDQSILTMYSADLEFDNVTQSRDVKDYLFRIVGLVPITSFMSSYDIMTNTPPNKFFNKENDSLLIPQGLYGSEIVGAKMENCGHGWKSFISNPIWHDDLAYNSFWKVSNANYSNSQVTPVGFAVYPWQGSGSLNNDSVGTRRTYPDNNDNDGKKESKSATGDNYVSAELKTKVLSNLHYSYNTHPLTDLSKAVQIDASAAIVLDEQSVSLTKLDNISNGVNGTLHYFGSVDKLITPISSGFVAAIDSGGTVTGTDGTMYSTSSRLSRKGGYPKMASFLPYLSHGFVSQSANHLAFYSPYTPVGYPNTLFASDYVTALGYPHTSGSSGWLPHDMKDGADRSMSSISIKYKSCNHFAIALGYRKDSTNIYQQCLGWLGSTERDKDTFTSTKSPFWTSGLKGYESINPFSNGYALDDAEIWSVGNPVDFNCMEFGRGNNSHDSSYMTGYLYMGQLYRTSVLNRFGGTSDEALEQNTWLPAGEAVYLSTAASRTEDSTTTPISIVWSAGDTYYQRYDALRTYPFAEEDQNKIVDIVSFMTETHTNIDGRYDKNRGLTNNNHCRPTNFNKMNYVYSQRDNFFAYHALNPKKVHLDVFEYSFLWSLSKKAGALRDEWTHTTFANTYDCDGNKGALNSITRLDNNLVAFQDNGVAQILFDENVQIQASEGVPIELANSGKLQGLRYYTTEVGCQNKWSIAVFPNGIYWVDGNLKEMCVLGSEGIAQLSTAKLMSTWFRSQDNLNIPWHPGTTWTGFISNCDKTTGELFFTGPDTTLCYDTVLGEFSSFYDYNKTSAMFSINGTTLTVGPDRSILSDNDYVFDHLWLHRKNLDRHCLLYNMQYPSYVEIVCNSNNQGSDYGTDKIFDNMSWRADVWNYLGNDEWQYQPFTTFTALSGRNDYQTFGIQFNNTYPNGAQTSHPQKMINLRKKFKVWYTTIPRADTTDENKKVKDRIRDTWCHIRLTADESVSYYRHVLHDIVVNYFIP